MGLFDRFRNKPASGEVITEQSGTGNNMITSEKAALSDWFVADTETDLSRAEVFRMPIEGFATLGPAVAALLPQFRTVVQTTTVKSDGLYRLANKASGDVLKKAKNGNFWGAFKKADGGSRFAQLQKAGPIKAESVTVMPIDPVTLMVAAALFTIERKLDAIEETQKQILVSMEREQEAQIEADVKTLNSTLREFKFNWDKEVFVNGHYKQALDIKRKAEQNLQIYQKKLAEGLKPKNPFAAVSLNPALKDFKYYQISLYIYSLSSFVELMLLGDFREEHIQKIKEEIEERSMTYRTIYNECSVAVEKIADNDAQANIMDGIGGAGKMLGGLIGSIPLIKEGPVDEWLQDVGDGLKKSATGMKKKPVEILSSVSNPGTGIFIEKMDTLNTICNHTEKICFDREQVYLVAG